MSDKKDITTLGDIHVLVDRFYESVRMDETLAPIFEKAIGDHWDRHLDIMYRFWQSILLNVHTYTGNPFSKHAPLPIEKAHFDRWLSLFNATVDTYFQGDNAEEAKNRAFKMAYIFQVKLESMHRTGNQPLV